jgi:peptidyl-prolyl cis-trans isomerase D
LIAYAGAARANPSVTRSKDEAQQLANRLYRQVRRNPGSFAEVAMANSDGPTRSLGGDLGFFQEGVMDAKFFDFANKNRIGRMGVVETDFWISCHQSRGQTRFGSFGRGCQRNRSFR